MPFPNQQTSGETSQNTAQFRIKPRFDGHMVRHACGHMVEHALNRIPPADRQAKKQELQATVCRSCHTELQARAFVDFERDQNLPEIIEVSQGEREDARKIRLRLCTTIENERVNRTAAAHRMHRQGVLTIAERDRRIERLERAIQLIYFQAKSTWWIRREDATADEVLIETFDYIDKREALRAREANRDGLPLARRRPTTGRPTSMRQQPMMYATGK